MTRRSDSSRVRDYVARMRQLTASVGRRNRRLAELRQNPNWYEDGEPGTRAQWRERCIRCERELATRRD